MIIRRQWPAITWALIILIITGVPGNQIPEIPNFLEWLSPDKSAHLVLFGILSYLILYSNLKQYLKSNHRFYIVAFVVLISAIYGLITELLQYHVFVGRNGNIYDFYANVIGASLGGVAYFLQHAKNKA